MTTQDDFTAFWKAFPRRLTTPRITGKRKAREKCEALVRASGVTWNELIAGAKAYAHCDNVAAGYIKLPMTWLNNDGWEDEYDRPPEKDSPEWWRARCRDAFKGPYNLQIFSRHFSRSVPLEIRKEFPDLFEPLRVVEC